MSSNVKSEQDSIKTDVVAFDVKNTLACLFNIFKIIHYQNLVVDSRDRYAKYATVDGFLSEVNNGS